MNLKVKNISNIGGEVKAPPSKKVILIEQLYWHLLANGTSKIYDILFSQDVFIIY